VDLLPPTIRVVAGHYSTHVTFPLGIQWPIRRRTTLYSLEVGASVIYDYSMRRGRSREGGRGLRHKMPVRPCPALATRAVFSVAGSNIPYKSV
jgi:hypothetical protein